MIRSYLTRNWLGENSTRWGIAGIALATAMIVASFVLDPARWGDVAATLRNIGEPVMVAGIVGVLYRERGKKGCDE